MSRRDHCDYALAIKAAEKVVRELEINRLPVDPTAIARGLDIEVRPKPAHAKGASGMLLRVGNTFGITYSTHIDNVGFRNFSVAHELGHYYLPGHVDAVLADGDMHESHAGFLSGNRYEMEADHFAAGLLMPRSLFTEAMRVSGEGLQAIEGIADACRTSLTATAIRYAQCSRDPMAIIVSTADKINFCFMSESLKETDGLNWIRKGQGLSRDTATFAFNRDSQRVRLADRTEGASDLQDWFGSDFSVQVTEEVLGLGRYGKTLTVLGVPDLLERLEELQETEMLRDSWEPKFRL